VLVLGSAFIPNAFSYVFHFVLSRKLGPAAYGTLAALMAIGGMFGVLGSSVGTVAMQETARMWSAHLELRIPHFMRQTGLYVGGLALAIAGALMLASLLLGRYLHVLDAWLWFELAAWVALSLLAGYSRGAAQGAHRFWLFASSLFSEGVLRVVFAVLFVLMGFAVRGAIGGLACAALVGFFIVAMPLLFGGDDASDDPEHLRLGGEALKILAVNMTAAALLFIDMLFAKHHFSADTAGYFGAAGTIARTIPYAASFIALILMPKAAAALHVSRHSLTRVLGFTAGMTAVCVVAALALINLFGPTIVGVTYGPAFTGAQPILRAYTVDEAHGRVHVYDAHGTLHDVSARLAPGQPPIGRGRQILVTDYDAAHGFVVVEELP